MQVLKTPSANPNPSACPHATPDGCTARFAKPAVDQIKFGMERNPTAGCCVTRFLGGESGCCPGIQSGKPFEKEYITALKTKIKNTGVFPQLDERVTLKLTEMNQLDSLKAMATGKPASRLMKILTSPFRWFAHVANSLWQDLRQIGKAKPATI